MASKDQTDLQKRALSKLETIHDEYMDSKRNIRREIEARFEAELMKIRVRESMAANEAIKAGASLTKVGRAMGTSDWRTIQDRLALTAEEFAVKQEVPSWVIDWDAKTGVLNWFEWDGERTEGPLDIVIAEDPEEFSIKGVRYTPSYNEYDNKDNPLVQVLAANEPYFALCRAVDAAARKQYGR